MRHFGHIAPEERQRLFHQEPAFFTADSPGRVLAAALGATLYSPATRPRLADDVVKQAGRGVVSMVLCLEDSIDDTEVTGAEENLVRQFADLAGLSQALGSSPKLSASLERGDPHERGEDPHERGGPPRAGGTPMDAELPLLFVRVRTPEQIPDLVRRLGPAVRLLSGFVLPKFTEERGVPFLEALTAAEAASGRRLFAMPVLESPDLLYLETRLEALQGISRTVDKYRERVLALRLGVTDFCSSYALRRAPDMTVYDVQIVASVIVDVVNVLGRADGTGFTVTGPVWEYFRVQERMFKPQLRTSPFLEVRAGELRETLIEHAMDGLLREISLDQANGLLGKTCIHPSHVLPVHALSVVSHEEFSDAQDILKPERGGGGVLRSAYTNKMNEVKPHRAWAERVLQRAEVFGVANEDIGFVELLAAGLPAD